MPRDTNQVAALVVDMATGEAPAEPPADSAKNPAAVALGRLGGLKGGKARAASLTKRERAAAAKKAAEARWKPNLGLAMARYQETALPPPLPTRRGPFFADQSSSESSNSTPKSRTKPPSR
jgi:hypothetical protein